jgi:ABC-type glycerol-3-phosphate transport system substrate-binding protein
VPSAAAVAACAGPRVGDAPPPGAAGGAAAQAATLRVHVPKRTAVSDWIELGLREDVDGWQQQHPRLRVTLETHGAWTDTYFPQVIALAASGQLGDVVWYPPRHRSHVAWGTKLKLVRDLQPLVKAHRFDLGQFYKGAVEHNTWEGKLYWLSYISEPVVPLVAVNKARAEQLGLGVPPDDWTFDDLAAWAKRGTVADAFGYFRGEAGTDPFGSGPYLRQWGVEPVDAAGRRAAFLDRREAFVQALTFRHSLTNVWRVSPNPADGPIAQDKLFGVERRLLAADIWPNRVQWYARDYPDLELAFALTPTVKKGDKRRSLLNEHVLGVTTASPAPDAAFAFLAWATGREMNVQGALRGGKAANARPDAWGDPRLLERWPAYRKLLPVLAGVEPDFVVANFRGEEFDAAFAGPYARLERGEAPVLDTAAEIQRLTQEVLQRDPA